MGGKKEAGAKEQGAMQRTDSVCPEKTLKPGESLFGFRVLRVKCLPDIRVTAYDLEHERTGAKFLHLHCSDRENLFSVGFRTPPTDSTGVPHILEHSVLAGSEHYPVKDAFNELLKGTLQTFINAFTYPDKTVYPVASQVYADFFNLAQVYCDLVFRPRLSKETFSQEGHHLEFENPDSTESPLTVSGIVFNEMRGAYSSPDSLIYKYIQENLYPDTPYMHDSGGDPREIPNLTYEEFKSFHRRYYSPSNARFFVYGDIPTKDHLRFLETVLAGFERIEVDSHIADQPRMERPIRIHGQVPIGRGESPARKTEVDVAWVMADNRDYETVLLLEILSEALVGSAAGPLRKALIDSGLGEDLSAVTGLVTDLKQVMFAAGLRGTEAEHTDQIASIILRTLTDLAEQGIDREVIEGALHQIEFGGREIIRRNMPYAILLLQRAYTTWLYDGDPLIGLDFPASIEAIRRKWVEDPELFQKVIRRWFVENPHRVISLVEPSDSFLEERQRDFSSKMARLKATLSRAELEQVREEAAHLRRIQSEPDPPEVLASLPELKLSDIPRTIESIPSEAIEIAGVPGLKHNIFTNGIAYLELAFDVSDVPEELQPYLPILGKLTTGVGAAGASYEDMAKRIARSTGGIGLYLGTGMRIEGKDNWQKIIMNVRSLHRNIPEAVGIVRDFLVAADFSNRSRVRDLILESKNRLRSAVVPSGHLFARRTAAAALNLPAYRDEQWNGRTQLKLLTEEADRFTAGKDDLLEKIGSLYDMLLRRERMFLNLTGDAEGLALLADEIARMLEALKIGKRIGSPGSPTLRQIDAGVAIPAQVCYVAKVVPAPFYRDGSSAPLLVLSRLLSNNYLYKRIRVQGGAYGGMSQYDPVNGIFSFLSYRDPNLTETLKIYNEAIDYVGKGIDGRDLEKAIIGTIGQIDRPMDPASRGYTSMIRHFSGLTEEVLLEFRNRVLDCSEDSIVEVARRHIAPSQDGKSVVAVYAPQERLEKANEVLERKLVIETLP